MLGGLCYASLLVDVLEDIATLGGALLMEAYYVGWRLGARGASLGLTLGGLDDVELVLELIVELGVGGM